MKNKIIKFGFWEIQKDYGLVAKFLPGYEYYIEISRLWETKIQDGYILWYWLIFLTEKKWITLRNINNLNIAFLFAVDYFKNLKPKNCLKASTSQTLYYQRHIMKQEADFERKIRFTGNPKDINPEEIIKFYKDSKPHEFL